MPNVYIRGLSKAENMAPGDGPDDSSQENEGQQPESMIAPPPPPPPTPGEGAVSSPGTAAGVRPVHGSGSTPSPSAGSAAIPSGGAPIVTAGGKPRFNSGMASLSPMGPTGDDLKDKQPGTGATFSYPTTANEKQHGEQDEQMSNLTFSGPRKSFGFVVECPAFSIMIKGDQPVTPRRVVDGVPLRLENPSGTVRQGVSEDGLKWKTTMMDDYGYIPGIPGVDGDSLDVYVGPEARKIRDTNGKEGSFDKVWVVHAKDPKTGKYDEDKVMFGFKSKDDAIASFRRHYDAPDEFLGPVNEFSLDQFKKKIKELKGSKQSKRLGVGRKVL